MEDRMIGEGVRHAAEQPLRADAKRNHDLLIDVAATVFAELGVDAPIKEIASRAGVGVGTFYRRFPKRSDLIVAVFRREVETCASSAEVFAGQHAPFDALRHWIERYVDLIVTKRGLAAALHSGEPAYEGLPEYFEARLTPPLEELLKAAGEELETRVSANELLRAVALLCAPAASGDYAQTRRMVTLLVNGLRVASDS
ncbi:TetR/AcrR family transcriptional regulator [Acidiphilium multivorum]|uniref:TetR/AcrR family transcriptional regulator n=1 Tax=Acidiphilium multivorum TaxID=62140 RepID=UPI001B8C6DD8|nr:TetR/AcrR family transcriptional regulator [Acidiphilium multivorum]MBS3025087.1 helix-turn-helix transcriptional regulator [Acidiphilium multivorum]